MGVRDEGKRTFVEGGLEMGILAAKEWVVEATINQDLDLIKSCIEVKRVAARRAAVQDWESDRWKREEVRRSQLRSEKRGRRQRTFLAVIIFNYYVVVVRPLFSCIYANWLIGTMWKFVKESFSNKKSNMTEKKISSFFLIFSKKKGITDEKTYL